MRERKGSGRGGRRRTRGDEGPDLFSQELAKAVQQGFEIASGETARDAAAAFANAAAAHTGPVAVPGDPGVTVEPESRSGDRYPTEVEGARQPSGLLQAAQESPEQWMSVPQGATEDPLPARMLNEFVYCPRLFYYEHVEGVFVESEDTLKGTAIHKRVDKGSGAMPGAKLAEEKNGSGADGEATTPIPVEPDEIHSRSVMLGSDRLGVVAKMDLVESTMDGAGGVAKVCPVDYKAGSPREDENGGITLWDTDRMQLGLQCLILRDNGYSCEEGIIYYRGTKQRVPLLVTVELEAWIVAQIAAARVVAAGPIPVPLVDSPKCVRCSLAPVCLPDETHMLSILNGWKPDGEQPEAVAGTSRRLIAARDERRALYLNTPGVRVGCAHGVLQIKESKVQSKRSKKAGGKEQAAAALEDTKAEAKVDEVRVNDVCHVALFGNIQLSTQAVQLLCERDVPVTWFSMGGWFYGVTRGHSLTNVLVRIEQFRRAADPRSCLQLAQQFVRGKIHNQRVFFMRNHEQPPERAKLRLGQAREDALATTSLESLLGVEGAAAAVYFEHFAGILRRPDETLYPEVETPKAEAPWARFDFRGRNRRPPTDPVNALLSLAYSLLAKECTIAAHAVGLDPYVGFYHQPRHGRPALALDVMEEFRPLIAESAVITAINNRFVTPGDFVTAGKAVNLNPAGRKQFFQCFEQRINGLVTHPVFGYKVSYRRAIELQLRMLSRVLTGEIPEYIPFMTR